MSRLTMIAQLLALGVKPGRVLIVHTAFSRVSPVEGGPEGLIQALEAAVGAQGTLVMPSLADDDEHPFDAASTPCAGMGIVADTFWRRRGVVRSDSPHAFAASGPRAAAITAPQPVDIPHGLDSPAGRGCALDADILLLGVGHDANTTIHVAENLANVRYRKIAHATVLEAGRPTRHVYAEVDHCCQGFNLMDAWLEAEGRQRRGLVGHAVARLVRSRDVVQAALSRLCADETVFLHPPSLCAECDEARIGVPAAILC